MTSCCRAHLLPTLTPMARHLLLAIRPLIATASLATCRSESNPRLDLPPIVDAGPDVRARPGDPVTLTIRFGRSAKLDGPWLYKISWGDGTVDSGSTASSSSPITAAHAYSALGQHVVQATVSETDGQTGSDSLAVFVEAPGTPQVLVGAGDIATCNATHDEATATLLETIPGTVFTLGDNAYPDGTPADYANCYQSSWGRHKQRTRPAPGNHDYETSRAAGYFGYFGVAAGNPTQGYYSYSLGDWHIIVLNSSIDVRAGSPQERWLRADLAANTKRCALAYWHHARFSSGTRHGSNSDMQPLWQALYDAGADIVLSGHEHNYERFAPQTPDGRADPVSGIRQFVVGTGGKSPYPFGPPLATSEVRNNTAYGVLTLTLAAGSYAWQFVPVSGQTFGDSGSGTCH